MPPRKLLVWILILGIVATFWFVMFNFQLPGTSQYGFIDRRAKLVIERSPIGRSLLTSMFSEGLTTEWSYDSKQLHYVGRNGKRAIKQSFETALPFSEGLAAVKVADKYGYIDGAGIFRIRPQFSDAGSFASGLAAVRVQNKWGYADKSGRLVIQPRYDAVLPFNENLAAVMIGKKVAFIDKSGNVVLGPEFDTASSFSNGLALVDQARFIDKSGNVVVSLGARQPVSGVLGMRLQAPVSLSADPIHETANQIGKTRGATIHAFSEGVAVAPRNGRFGYVDKRGEFVIPASFDYAYPFKEGRALVFKDGNFGYINHSGALVIAPTYELAHYFHEGLAAVKTTSGKWGYIDKTGAMVIKPIYAYAYPFWEGLAKVGARSPGP